MFCRRWQWRWQWRWRRGSNDHLVATGSTMTALVGRLRQGVLIGLVLGAVGWPAHDGTAAEAAVKPDPFTDFRALHPPASPNTWLVAPPEMGPDNGSAAANQAAPVFDVPAARLAQAWRCVVEAQPRTAILSVSPDGLQIEAQQKSAVFGFVDRISMRAIPLAPRRSTLIAYSRAMLGYWDFGVNRRRLQAWLKALRSELAVSPPPDGR